MISPAELETLRSILQKTTGHALEDGKEYLVESRLRPVAESLGHPDVPALLRHLRAGRDERIERLVSEAMATHETLFFRDGRPFADLADRILPELLERRAHTGRLRIWSAGCATGQEVYSVAMLLEERRAALRGWQIEIVGTDFASRAIQRARTGIYHHFEVQRGLSAARLCRHFHRVGEDWCVNEELRRYVRFEVHNLLDSFRHLGTFDLILCRNVLFYFEAETKRHILNRFADVTAPDGYLILGASETALGISDRWLPVPEARTALFRRRATADLAPGRGDKTPASA